MRALPTVACTVLRTLGRIDDLGFPNKVGGIMVGYRKAWLKIAKFGALPGDITPHVLRHSFESLAGDLGNGEATIATLIGHKGHSITSRHIHTAGSGRCCGKCHMEIDGSAKTQFRVGSSATLVAIRST